MHIYIFKCVSDLRAWGNRLDDSFVVLHESGRSFVLIATLTSGFPMQH